MLHFIKHDTVFFWLHLVLAVQSAGAFVDNIAAEFNLSLIISMIFNCRPTYIDVSGCQS